MMLLWSMAFALDAEGERVAEELLKYAADGKWNAVEAQYTRVLRDHPSQMTDELHRLGAQAARTNGDLLLSAQRLQRVPEASDDHAAAQQDLSVLQNGTGLVMVRARKTFAPVAKPFAPDLRLAVDHAAEQVGDRGWFVGLLPVGDYQVDGVTLHVAPGFHWQVLALD